MKERDKGRERRTERNDRKIKTEGKGVNLKDWQRDRYRQADKERDKETEIKKFYFFPVIVCSLSNSTYLYLSYIARKNNSSV